MIERARLVERTVVVRDSLFAKRSRIDPRSLERLGVDTASLDGRTRAFFLAPTGRCLSSRQQADVVEVDRVQWIAGRDRSELRVPEGPPAVALGLC